MTTNKRLRKMISFSNHEKDIYDYLDKHDNASSLIKKLVLTHMIREEGLGDIELAVLPKKELKKKDVAQETEPPIPPTEPPVEPPKLTQEDIENKALADMLDI